MTVDEFRRSLSADGPPEQLGPALAALWWDAKGDWHRAHDCAQALDDAAGSWIHAYPHRKEGDRSNAGYWYQRAGKAAATVSPDEEWEQIAAALIAGRT